MKIRGDLKTSGILDGCLYNISHFKGKQAFLKIPSNISTMRHIKFFFPKNRKGLEKIYIFDTTFNMGFGWRGRCTMCYGSEKCSIELIIYIFLYSLATLYLLVIPVESSKDKDQ